MTVPDNPAYPWQRAYDVEQMNIELPEVAGVTTRRPSLRPCNALAPDDITICGFAFTGALSFCQRIKGHPGGHSTKPSTCNRPLDHEGPHALIVMRDARKLGEW